MNYSIFYVHVLFLLGIVLNVFSGVGYCYFFSRRVATIAPTQGPDASISDIDFRSIKRQQQSYYNAYPSSSSPHGYSLNSVAQVAALPFPISIQLPQHLIPFAVIPSSAFNQNNQGRQSISTYSAQSSSTQAVGDNYIQQSINQNRPEGHSLQQSTHNALPAIHFMPCLCNNANKEQRWPKAVYQTGVHVAPPTAYQAIQMVPCYCSVIHDINEHSVPPASSVPDVSENKSATGSTSTVKA